METTVDFRRKLLGFDRPLYPMYRKSSIPKYYSNFYPVYHTRFNTLDCANVLPDFVPPIFPAKVTQDCSHITVDESGDPRRGTLFYYFAIISVIIMLLMFLVK